MKIKLMEEVENWDSARVIDIVRYCVNKGCDVDKTFKVVYNQMKEEGSTLPKDLSVLRKAVLDAYDDVDFDESLTEDMSTITLKDGRTYPIKDKDFLKGKTAGYSNENGLEHIFNIKTKSGKRYAIYDSGFGNMSHADRCAVLLDESILDRHGYKKCPYCHNHTLVEIDFGDYICDECGEEFSGYEDYYGNIIPEKEVEEPLSEELKEDKMQELVEKLVDVSEEELTELENIFAKHGFSIDSKGKTFLMGDIHYQIRDNSGSHLDIEDVKGLRDYVDPLIKDIHDFEAKVDTRITWNFGLDKNGVLTGGLNVMKKYVKDEDEIEEQVSEELNENKATLDVVIDGEQAHGDARRWARQDIKKLKDRGYLDWNDTVVKYAGTSDWDYFTITLADGTEKSFYDRGGMGIRPAEQADRDKTERYVILRDGVQLAFSYKTPGIAEASLRGMEREDAENGQNDHEYKIMKEVNGELVDIDESLKEDMPSLKEVRKTILSKLSKDSTLDEIKDTITTELKNAYGEVSEKDYKTLYDDTILELDDIKGPFIEPLNKYESLKESKKLNELGESDFLEPIRARVRLDIDKLDDSNKEKAKQFFINQISNWKFAPEVLVDYSDGTYQMCFPGKKDWINLVKNNCEESIYNLSVSDIDESLKAESPDTYYVKYLDINSTDAEEKIKYFSDIEDAKKFVDDNDEKTILVKASNIHESLSEAQTEYEASLKEDVNADIKRRTHNSYMGYVIEPSDRLLSAARDYLQQNGVKAMLRLYKDGGRYECNASPRYSYLADGFNKINDKFDPDYDGFVRGYKANPPYSEKALFYVKGPEFKKVYDLPESLKEDVNSFSGKTLKDFLRTVDHRVRINLSSEGRYDFAGNPGGMTGGLSGRAHDVPWYLADKKIISITEPEDKRFYDYNILIESAGNGLKESADDVYKDFESISEYLNKNNFTNFDLSDYKEGPLGVSKIVFDIEGDWKHDHLRFDLLLNEWAEETGRKIVNKYSEEIGDSDSDYYEALHTVFIAKDDESYETLNSLRPFFKESLEDTDGWEEDKVAELVEVCNDIYNLNYELENAVRGTYTNADTYSELSDYVLNLASRLSDAAETISELDESCKHELEEDKARDVSTVDMYYVLVDGEEVWKNNTRRAFTKEEAENYVRWHKRDDAKKGEEHQYEIKFDFSYDPLDVEWYKRLQKQAGMKPQDWKHDTKSQNESLSEDTIKQNGKWVNKGKEGTHGKFKTKKEADAQRKAMFAQGYKEELKEDCDPTMADLAETIYHIWLNNSSRYLKLGDLRAKADNEISELSDKEIISLVREHLSNPEHYNLRASKKAISCPIIDYKKMCLDHNLIYFTFGPAREDKKIENPNLEEILKGIDKVEIPEDSYHVFGNSSINVNYPGGGIGGFKSIAYPVQVGNELGYFIDEEEADLVGLDYSEVKVFDKASVRQNLANSQNWGGFGFYGESLKEDLYNELEESDGNTFHDFGLFIYLNTAGRERRAAELVDFEDFITEYPQSEEEFLEIITDELELADWEDINTEEELIAFLENQDYSFGDPIIYKAIWKGSTIYDDSDYFETLKKELQDNLSKIYREDLDESWRDAYEKFNAVVDKHFTFDDVDPDAIEAEIEELYRFHEGEPDWEEAYRRWTSEVKESDLSEEVDHDEASDIENEEYHDLEEAVKNPNFDREKYGRFFDENDRLIPELAKEYFDLVHQEQKAQYDFSSKEASLNEAARGRYVGSGYIDADAIPDVFDYDDEIHDRLGEEECDFYRKGQNDYAAVFSDGYERDVPREYAIITSEPQKGRKLPFAFVAVNHPTIPLGTKKNGEEKFGSNLSSVDSVRIDPVGTVEDHSFFGPSGWKNWMGTGGNISRWCQALGVDMKNLAEVRLGDRYVLFTLKDGSQVAGEDIRGVSYYISRDFKPVSLHEVIEALYDSSKEVVPSWNKSAYHGTLGYVQTSNPLLQSAEFIREE